MLAVDSAMVYTGCANKKQYVWKNYISTNAADYKTEYIVFLQKIILCICCLRHIW